MPQLKILKNASYFSKLTLKTRRSRIRKTNYKKSTKIIKFFKSIYKLSKYKCQFRSTYNILACTFVYPSLVGDVVIQSINSKNLTKYGYSLSSTHSLAAYFLGLLSSRKIILKNQLFNSKSIFAYIDIGFNKPNTGSKMYSLIKGLTQGGLDVPYSFKNSIVNTNLMNLNQKLGFFFFKNCSLTLFIKKNISTILKNKTPNNKSLQFYNYFFNVLIFNFLQIHNNIIKYSYMTKANRIPGAYVKWKPLKLKYLERKSIFFGFMSNI